MPPNPPSNSRLPRLAVWSGHGTAEDEILCCNRLKDSSLPVLSNGGICFQYFTK